jgi:hypothetical protein
MKPLITIFISFLTFLSFSQNVIEVSISKIGIFSKYGKDSLHLMIAKSECGHYSRSYDPIDLKLIINKSQKKIYRFKNNKPTDTLPIKKITLKDSTYIITVSELCDPNYAEYEGQMIDCYLVLDTKKNTSNKNTPKFCYYWNWKFYMNDDPVDYFTGRVSDFVTIK